MIENKFHQYILIRADNYIAHLIRRSVVKINLIDVGELASDIHYYTANRESITTDKLVHANI